MLIIFIFISDSKRGFTFNNSVSAWVSPVKLLCDTADSIYIYFKSNMHDEVMEKFEESFNIIETHFTFDEYWDWLLRFAELISEESVRLF